MAAKFDEPRRAAGGDGGSGTAGDGCEGRHEVLFAEYIDRLNAGEKLDRERVRTEHPELADELLRQLEAYQTICAGDDLSGLVDSFGDYRLVRRVGRGGMGVVYEAWQNSMDRRVALKVLPAGVVADSRAVSRFVREARVAGKLHHPNVVSVYGMGVESSTPYYAMEFVDGETLAQILARLRTAGGRSDEERRTLLGTLSRLLGGGGPQLDAESTLAPLDAPGGEPGSADFPRRSPLDAEDADALYCYRVARAFAGVVDGLQHAHERGIIHRDIKPSNLILDLEGNLRVLDFGLARLEGQESLTASGDLIGTVLYMSPEQAMARRIPIDHRTDIYSLGATLYEMVTWQAPFRGKSNQDTLSQIIFREPLPPRRINPRIPRDLETVVLKCLSKDPGQRYGTAEALAQDLRRFARGDPIEARPQAAWEKLARRAWRARRRLAAAAVFLALAAALGFMILEGRIEADRLQGAAYDTGVRDAAREVRLGRFSSRHGAENPLRLEHIGMLIEQPGERLFPTGRADPVEEAVAKLERLASLRPGRPDARYHRARGLLVLGKEDEALEELDRALESDRGFVPALVLEASILERRGDGAAARRLLEQAERAAATEESRALLQAHRAERQGLWREAAAAYDRLLEMAPGGGEPYIGAAEEIRIGRGLVRYLAGELLAAIGDFHIAIRDWRDSLEPILLLGLAYHREGKVGETEKIFKAFHDRTPLKDQAARSMAAAYYYLEDRERFGDWIERIEDPILKARFRMAYLLNTRAAVALGRELVKEYPSDPQAHAALAVNLFLLNDLGQEDFEEARARFEEALELDQRLATAHFGLGMIHSRSGRFGEAVPRLEEAKRLSVSGSTWLHTELADAYDGIGDAERARREIEECLRPAARDGVRQNWIFAGGHMALGQRLEREGNLGEALRQYALALEVLGAEPHSGSFLHSLAPRVPARILREEEVGDLGPAIGGLIETLEGMLAGAKEPREDLLSLLALAHLRHPERSDPAAAVLWAERAAGRAREPGATVLWVLAEARAAAGRLDLAARTLERADRSLNRYPGALALLARCRQELLPRLPSFASVDALLDEGVQEVIIPRDARWRFHRGLEEPSTGQEWTRADFVDAAWEEGPGPIGRGDYYRCGTRLDDMPARYTTVFIRRRFEIPDPGAFSAFFLFVRADDGFVAYANGSEVERLGAPLEERPAHDAVAAVKQFQASVRQGYQWVRIPPALLRAGENCLAIQGLNAPFDREDFLLDVVLLGARRVESAAAGAILEGFRTAAATADRSVLLYLEGRLLARDSKHREAAERFAPAAEAAAHPAPLIELGRSLRLDGRPGEAEAALRARLLEFPRSRELWELWLAIALDDLELPAAECRSRLGDGASLPAESPAADVAWLLERLAAGEPLRLNCGGGDQADPRGRAWSRDRFFLGGQYPDTGRIAIPAPEQLRSADAVPLYHDQRWFPERSSRPAAYRIPLPRGKYRVTLHFAEIEVPDRRQHRVFSVALEGETRLRDHEPLERGFATAHQEARDVEIADGALDIEFIHRIGTPAIAAIEIAPAE